MEEDVSPLPFGTQPDRLCGSELGKKCCGRGTFTDEVKDVFRKHMAMETEDDEVVLIPKEVVYKWIVQKQRCRFIHLPITW
jgi:hypothetical protein